MDKKEQAKLLTEIMKADAKDGLYEPAISKMETTQTAVGWLIEQLKQVYDNEGKLPLVYTFELLRQAKQMERQQIQKAFSDGQETPINHPTLPHYSREEYYNDNYNK